VDRADERRIRLTIIVLTYNEAPDVPEPLQRIKRRSMLSREEGNTKSRLSTMKAQTVLLGIVRDASRGEGLSKNVKAMVGRGKRDLPTAVLERVKAAQGEHIIVMDANLRHPHEKVPEVHRNTSLKAISL